MLGRPCLALAFAISIFSSPAVAQERSGPTFAFGGDVLYDAPLAYQVRRRSRSVGRDAAWAEVFADLEPSLRSADLALVNLEVPISARYRERDPVQDVPVFRAPEEFLDALRTAGVDAFTIANNHAYDQGMRGLRNTISAASRRNVPLIGFGDDRAGAARARVIRVNGARIAIAAWTEGTNNRPRSEEGSSPRIAFLRDGTVREAVRRARTESDFVIAVFHWVREDLTRPRLMMREAAREAADAGADLIIGHGTHVPGSTEVIVTDDGRRVRVLYSLGNLLAAMEEPAGTLSSHEVGVRDAPLAMVATRWRNRRLEVSSVEVRHHWIARPVGRAPWMSGGTLAVSRPVAIAQELERIDRSQCGRICDFRATAYRRRVALVESAMADLGEPMPPREPLVVANTDVATARAAASARRDAARAQRASARDAERAQREASRDAARAERVRRDAERAAERERRGAERRDRLAALAASRAEQRAERTAELASEREAERERRAARLAAAPRAERAPRRRTARVVIPDADPRLAPYLRGVVIPMEFHEGRVAERTVDAGALSRVVALMVEDRGLHAEITGYSTEAEAGERSTLGAMRARRLKVLIAGRGPSRSRFTTRGGRPGQGRRAGSAHVVIRLRRR